VTAHEVRRRDSGSRRDGSFEDDEDGGKRCDALELLLRLHAVSIPRLQRHLRTGHNRAARLLERMQRERLVVPVRGSHASRPILARVRAALRQATASRRPGSKSNDA
jgi:DNA segregation ATPase FtsK/SpoIIIE-like protein